MENKAGLLIVTIILLAAAIVGQYYWRLHDQTQEVSELRVLLVQAKNMLEIKKAAAQSRGRTLESDKALVVEFKAVETEHAQLTKDVAVLATEFLAVQTEFGEAVTKVRTAAGNLPPEDILLKSGQLLSGAKVHRMSHEDITYQHAGGILKVDVKDLPPQVRDRFRQQMPPFDPEEGIKDPASPPERKGAKKA